MMIFSLWITHYGDVDWIANLERDKAELEKKQELVTVVPLRVDEAVNQDRCSEETEEGIHLENILKQESIRISE